MESAEYRDKKRNRKLNASEAWKMALKARKFDPKKYHTIVRYAFNMNLEIKPVHYQSVSILWRAAINERYDEFSTVADKTSIKYSFPTSPVSIPSHPKTE